MKKIQKLTALATLIGSAFAMTSTANAAITLVDTGDTKVTLGGYLKADLRHVNGDVPYSDYWLGVIGSTSDTSATGINIKESRLNIKATQGEVTGFVEFDLYGGDGNEIISNSTAPRLRHATIDYKNWKVGQFWTTHMPLHALPETLDFGGPMIGMTFIRQAQIRYTSGPFQFAIETAETFGDGDVGAGASAVGSGRNTADPDEDLPDLIARYNHSADWGIVSASALIRKIDQGGIDETTFALNIGAKINVGKKDDFKFQINVGEPGRYVGVAAGLDLVNDVNNIPTAESIIGYTVSFRHFWNDKTRSTIFLGGFEQDQNGGVEDERRHYGVNVITNLTPKLSFGAEIGQYEIEEGARDDDSAYLQFSLKYVI